MLVKKLVNVSFMDLTQFRCSRRTGKQALAANNNSQYWQRRQWERVQRFVTHARPGSAAIFEREQEMNVPDCIFISCSSCNCGAAPADAGCEWRKLDDIDERRCYRPVTHSPTLMNVPSDCYGINWRRLTGTVACRLCARTSHRADEHSSGVVLPSSLVSSAAFHCRGSYSDYRVASKSKTPTELSTNDTESY